MNAGIEQKALQSVPDVPVHRRTDVVEPKQIGGVHIRSAQVAFVKGLQGGAPRRFNATSRARPAVVRPAFATANALASTRCRGGIWATARVYPRRANRSPAIPSTLTRSSRSISARQSRNPMVGGRVRFR